MNNRKLYQRAINAWGISTQVTVAIEELSELIKELCKAQRSTGDLQHIAEEVADVEIMCEQLRHIFDIDSVVDAWKESKLKRLEQRLK